MTKMKFPMAIGLAAFAMACSDPSTGPTRTLVGTGVDAAVVAHPINFGAGGTYPANLADGVVRLCKTGNAAGSFSFTWSLNDAAPTAIPGGPIVLTGAGTVCRNIYTSTIDNTIGVDKVVITEGADATNWALTGRNIDQYFGQFVSYPAPRLSGDNDATPARGVTVYINDDMAKLVTFTNTFTAPSTGCTYTKGWYRNHGSSTIDATIDGRTIAQQQAIFDATPGKPGNPPVTWGDDNLLLNLYQQLLAALNNLNGDATGGPAAVDAAISAALGGTGGTGLNITTTLTHDQMSDLVDTLSDFNEGTFTGWPHCDD